METTVIGGLLAIIGGLELWELKKISELNKTVKNGLKSRVKRIEEIVDENEDQIHENTKEIKNNSPDFPNF